MFLFFAQDILFIFMDIWMYRLEFFWGIQDIFDGNASNIFFEIITFYKKKVKHDEEKNQFVIHDFFCDRLSFTFSSQALTKH